MTSLFSFISKEELDRLILSALEEDIKGGDITTEVLKLGGRMARGTLLAKQELVLAGLDIFGKVFELRDSSVTFEADSKDGDLVKERTEVAEISGKAVSLLSAERIALNFLTHLCGIATLTYWFVEEVRGTEAKILDTRKTTPGLGVLEKYAVKMGGGENHRMGLYDAILVKDNHIALLGGVTAVYNLVRQNLGGREVKFVEFEVETLDQLEEALSLGIGRILLDNMDLPTLKKAVEINKGRALLEASGGVNLENVRQIAETGVDFISIGALTHSAPAADLSLETEVV